MNVSNDVNPLECTICYENFNDPHITKCGHTFCKTCIIEWIEKDPSCPSCRTPVKKTNPNVFARQMVEAAAKKVEEAAQPVIESAKKTHPVATIEEVTESVAVMQLSKSPEAVAPLPPLLARKNSLVAVKKVAAVEAAPKNYYDAEIAELRNVKKTIADPVGVKIKVFNRNSGQIDSFLMPQTKGNAKAVKEALETKKLPAQHLKDIGARAKVDTLIIDPPINVQDFIKSQGNLSAKIPTKTFETIHGLEFHDGVAILSTDRGDLYYRATNEFREYYLAVSTPQALQNIVDKVVMHLLVQPNQLQIQASAPKSTLRDEVIQSLQQGLKKSLQNPDAHFVDIIELENPTDPTMQLYVGITMDRPIKKPVAQEHPGCPITVATTIDKLPELLKLLGRIQ